jgi:hypothetical protein
LQIYSRSEVAHVCNAMLRMIVSRQIHRDADFEGQSILNGVESLEQCVFLWRKEAGGRYKFVRKAVGDVWECAGLFGVELVVPRCLARRGER